MGEGALALQMEGLHSPPSVNPRPLQPAIVQHPCVSMATVCSRNYRPNKSGDVIALQFGCQGSMWSTEQVLREVLSCQ